MLYTGLMRQFGTEQYEKALSFLKNQARPLESRRWDFFIGKISAVQVLKELEKYRNSDGGFGNALEPDMRSGKSSVLATLEALGIMAELNITTEDSSLCDALKWLTNAEGGYDSGRRLWPYLTSGIDNSPRAPWWNLDTLEEAFSGFLINPRARVLSSLYRWQTSGFVFFPETELESILEDTVKHAESLPSPVSPNTLISLLELVSAPNIPENQQHQLSTVVRRMIPESVETDPAKWTEYCLQPLDVVDSQDSPWMDLLSEAVPNHLDYIIDAQEPAGSWSPFWNWSGAFPEAWQDARREWAGVLTFKYLGLLSSFGRIENNPVRAF